MRLSAQKGVKFGYNSVCVTPINAMEDVCIFLPPLQAHKMSAEMGEQNSGSVTCT